MRKPANGRHEGKRSAYQPLCFEARVFLNKNKITKLNNEKIRIYMSNKLGVMFRLTPKLQMPKMLLFFLSATMIWTITVKAQTIYNVTNYGALGNGVHDDTTNIQAAINAAYSPVNAGKTVYFPPGFYLVTSTLMITNGDGITLNGDGIDRSFIYRTGNYGSTLQIGGSASSDVMDNVRISNLYFYHSYGSNWNPPSIGTLVNKPTSGAHIVAYGLSDAKISDCEFWNMPTQIHFLGGANNYLVNNVFGGLFDSVNSGYQVTTENVLLEKDTVRNQLPTDYYILNNKSFGYTTNRTLTFGTWSANTVDNLGSSVGIRIKACELVQIEGGQIGSMSDSGISIEPQNNTGCLDISIHGVFFDSCKGNAIKIINSGGTESARMVQIHGNNFNGEGNAAAAITIGAYSDTTPSVYGLMIDGNMIGGGFGTSAIYLLSGHGLNLVDNQIRNYNSHGGFTDGLNAVGVYASDNVHKVNMCDNVCGGSENFDGYGTNNYCQYGISYKSSDSTIHLNANIDFGVQTLINAY
jgi:hypothetical protein